MENKEILTEDEKKKLQYLEGVDRFFDTLTNQK